MPPSLAIMGPRPEGPPSSGSARSDPPPHVTQSPLPTDSLKSRRSTNRCFKGAYLAHVYVEWAAGGYSQCMSLPEEVAMGPRIRNTSWRRLVLVICLLTTSAGARSQETEPLEDQGTKADRSSGSLPAQDGRRIRATEESTPSPREASRWARLKDSLMPLRPRRSGAEPGRPTRSTPPGREETRRRTLFGREVRYAPGQPDDPSRPSDPTVDRGSDPKESVPWSGVSLLPHAR